jgi:uncharacterized membrane protein
VKQLLGLLRGFRGHPLHPPLTDATVGTFTVGTVLVLASWLGIAEDETVAGGLLALAFGLILTVPTVAAGFVDYLDIPRGTARWRTATVHWLAMVSAASVFLVAAALLQDDFDAGRAHAAGALCTLGAQLLLTVGGWLGGTLDFVHGERVLSLPGEPATRAILPQAIEREPVAELDAPEER